jgi:hypothetical protein
MEKISFYVSVVDFFSFLILNCYICLDKITDLPARCCGDVFFMHKRNLCLIRVVVYFSLFIYLFISFNILE